MGISVTLVLGVCLIVFGMWFFSRDTEITNYPPKNSTVVAFGDSLVYGQGATPGNDFVSVLGRALGKSVVNLGVSGNTTDDARKRLPEVLEYDPGVVILLIGGNDSLRRISLDVTKANLSAIIETPHASGAVVVLLGVRGGVIGDPNRGMYEDLSDMYGLPYLENVLDGLFGNPKFMFDGIHPNDAGYAIIAERVAQLFSKYKL